MNLLKYCLAVGVSLSILTSAGADDLPPSVQREFRAAWIATVANIDWPTKPGLSTAEQQRELAALLDTAVELNLNAVVLQVRPACDAIYRSELEPWSEYLTGEQGRPPSEDYDPLEWAVREAHSRGLQLHAWLNPYRASHPTAKSDPASLHVSNTLPNSVRKYGKYQWLDPADAEASQHSLDVLLDVVRRYDIDGVHFDDYFYPYPIDQPLASEAPADAKPSGKLSFPDNEPWQKYLDATPEAERMSRDDWRRDNINQFIRRVYEGVKQEKPHVMFGVSPFGIWRPGYPESIVGFDAYQAIYADSKLWLQKGWVDYLTPQLYWPIRSSGQSYPVLLNWWRTQNTHGRHLWPGNYTSRVGKGEGRGWKASEIVEQIALTRGIRGASGNVHFSMKALSRNYGGLADALKKGPYAEPAIVPETTWLSEDSPAPNVPEAKLTKQSGVWQLQLVSGKSDVWQHVVQWREGANWQTEVLSSSQLSFTLPSSNAESYPVAVTAVDRLGRTSVPAMLTVR